MSRGRAFSAEVSPRSRRLRPAKPVTVLEFYGITTLNGWDMAQQSVKLWRREAARGGVVAVNGDAMEVYTVPGGASRWRCPQ